MERSSFFKQTAFIALAVTVIQMALGSSFSDMAEHQNLFWVSQFVFLALTIISFFGGKYFVKKANKNFNFHSISPFNSLSHRLFQSLSADFKAIFAAFFLSLCFLYRV
jgi:hypothetical protein